MNLWILGIIGLLLVLVTVRPGNLIVHKDQLIFGRTNRAYGSP